VGSTLCKKVLGDLLAVDANMGHTEECELVDGAILLMLHEC
jgi:hypothetical protein